MAFLDKIKQIDYKSLIGIASILFYPFLILLILGYFLIPHAYGFRRELIAFGSLSLVLTFIVWLVPKFSIRKHLFLFSYLFLALLSFFKLSFYYLYGAKINASSLFIIFETNTSEASEFFSRYLDFKSITLLIVVFLPLIILINRLYFNKKKRNWFINTLQTKLKFPLVNLLVVLGLFVSIFMLHRYRSENFLLKSITYYQDYKIAKQNQRDKLAQPSSNYLKNIVQNDTSNNAKTYVIIVGESTARRHMQLYGYNRETNPLLSEIKDELIVFDSVISPHVHTLKSLDKILTLTDFKNEKLEENASIVQLSNQSGFSTYWLSNQKPVGITETLPTLIGNASQKQFYQTTDSYGYDVFDGDLLPIFKTILNDKSKSKLIFVHLIGAHGNYDKRYPKPDFNYFSGENTVTKFKHEKSLKLVNEYDNAVRYNDFVVRSIIDEVKATNINSYVLYFSDHGQDVYDTIDYAGHDEFRATKPMYEVPFLVWLSEDYKKSNPEYLNFYNYTKRKYIMEDFFHSFSDINNITFDGFDEAKSIFNPNFKTKTRWIKDQVDYDKKE